MITDKTLDAWKSWLETSIAADEDSILADIPIQMRDSEEVKTYPGIYIEEGGKPQRITPGGVMDGNSWLVEIITKLVTTPGDDDQAATSKLEHDAMRDALSPHISSADAKAHIDAADDIACHQLDYSQPETTEADGYRVTSWSCEAVVCG